MDLHTPNIIHSEQICKKSNLFEDIIHFKSRDEIYLIKILHCEGLACDDLLTTLIEIVYGQSLNVNTST